MILSPVGLVAYYTQAGVKIEVQVDMSQENLTFEEKCNLKSRAYSSGVKTFSDFKLAIIMATQEYHRVVDRVDHI